jgi:hypothetical protein
MQFIELDDDLAAFIWSPTTRSFVRVELLYLYQQHLNAALVFRWFRILT